MEVKFTLYLFLALLVGVHMKSFTLPLTKEKPWSNGSQSFETYYSKVGFGTNSKTKEINWIPVTFTTGQNWAWVETVGGTYRPANKDAILLNTADANFNGNGEVTIGLPDGMAGGLEGTLDLYFTEDIVIKDATIVAVNDAQGRNGTYASGQLGLAPAGGSNIINSLYDSGVITQRAFTLYYGEKADITIGEISHEHVASGSSFSFVDLVASGDEPGPFTFEVDNWTVAGESQSNFHAYLDTGYDEFLLSYAMAKKLFKNAFNECTFLEGQYLCYHDKDFPDMEFTIGGQKFTLKPEDYVYFDEGLYIPNLSIADTKTVYFGNTFLKKLVAAVDFDNDKIGFAKAAESSSVEAPVDFLPTADIN